MILSTLQVRLFAISPFLHFFIFFLFLLLPFDLCRSPFPFPLRFPSLKE
jgi:hypothetical protein